MFRERENILKFLRNRLILLILRDTISKLFSIEIINFRTEISRETFLEVGFLFQILIIGFKKGRTGRIELFFVLITRWSAFNIILSGSSRGGRFRRNKIVVRRFAPEDDALVKRPSSLFLYGLLEFQ